MEIRHYLPRPLYADPDKDLEGFKRRCKGQSVNYPAHTSSFAFAVRKAAEADIAKAVVEAAEPLE